jgi:6-pyruvoyltetrahydropterin/6-carboxytetrahydropterin synthase
MVADLAKVKAWMQTTVLDIVDHRNLDKDVPFFHSLPRFPMVDFLVLRSSTTENLAVFIWQTLASSHDTFLPASAKLFEVRIHETNNNIFYYRGD